MDVHYNYRYRYRIEDEDDRCNECDKNAVQEACNKCGEGVCMSSSCCESFPHHNNSSYIICRQCTSTIEHKLRLLMNHNDLKLLKQKISKKMAKKIQELTDENK